MAIDASKLVQIVPRVIGGGGSSLEFNGMILTKNALIPAGSVTQWSNADSVARFFGVESDEARIAAVYFKGFDNSSTKPTLLYFARFVDIAASAWLRGGVFGGDLAQLKAVTDGAMTLFIDNAAYSVNGVDFSTATSFSEAAEHLQWGLDGVLDGVTVTYSSQTKSFLITSPTTGENSAISFAESPTTGTDLSALLMLTEQTGAVISPGMNPQTPQETMQNILLFTRNWVQFMTLWEPSLDDKLLFSQWVNAYGDVRYHYVAWDTDLTATDPFSEASFGAMIQELELSGASPVYNTPELAAFVLGTGASINWDETNGRITWAFKQQSGLAITCDDPDAYDALLAHGYCCYADFHTANDTFHFFQNGQISGKYKWIDTYCDAIAINNDLQLAIMTLFSMAKSIPYNQDGYDRIRAACLDVINKYLNFGAIVPGVPLSELQASQVNTEAGMVISATLEQVGWYMQILSATAQNRSNRRTPPCKFWWMDGGSIQQISMESTAIL